MPQRGQVSDALPRGFQGLQAQAPKSICRSSKFTQPAVSDSAEAEPPPFACPFYRFNPVMCDECKKFRFFRISDVKQHLIRCHSQPLLSEISCATCYSVFIDEQSRMLHLDEGNCHIVVEPEKLSPSEVGKLKETRFPRGYGAVRQWLAIWNQLFPGHPEPHSPYIQPNGVQEVISLISPTIEIHLNAFLASSQQYCQNNIYSASASSWQMVMADVYRDFCGSLPTSRYRPSILGPTNIRPGQLGGVSPSSKMLPQLENTPRAFATTSRSFSVEDSLAQSNIANSVGPDLGLSSNVIANDAESRTSLFLNSSLSPSRQAQTTTEVELSGVGDHITDSESYAWMWATE